MQSEDLDSQSHRLSYNYMPVTSGKRNSASDIHNKIFIIQVEYKRHIPTCVQVSGILKLILFQWRNILFAWCQTRCYHGVIKLEIWKCPIFRIADIISTSSSFIVVGLKENWNQTPFLWFDDNSGYFNDVCYCKYASLPK